MKNKILTILVISLLGSSALALQCQNLLRSGKDQIRAHIIELETAHRLAPKDLSIVKDLTHSYASFNNSRRNERESYLHYAALWVQLEGPNRENLVQLFYALNSLNKKEEALTVSQELLKRFPEDATIQLYYVRALAKVGKVFQALAEIHRFKKEDENPFLALMGLEYRKLAERGDTDYSVREGYWAEAEKIFRRLIQKGSQENRHISGLIASLIGQRKFDAVVAEIEYGPLKLSSKEEENGRLARAYIGLNRLNEARTLIEEGLKTEPDNKFYLRLQGLLEKAEERAWRG